MNRVLLEKEKVCETPERENGVLNKGLEELSVGELNRVSGGIMPGEDGAVYTGVRVQNTCYCPHCLTVLGTTSSNYFICNKCGFTEALDEPDPKRISQSEYVKRKQSEGGSSACVTPETLVSLADGSQLPVKDLKGTEELLTWNFFTGKQDKAQLLLLEKKEMAEYEVITLEFSDGSKVGVVYEHGFYDVDAGKYIYLDKNAGRYVGHRFDKSGKAVTLVNVKTEIAVTEAYSPVTVGHVCCYVNGMLSVTGGIEGMLNYFEADTHTMKYDGEAMERDIQKNGLFTYDEFARSVPVTERVFEGMNCKYMKVAIGKGLVTAERLKQYSEVYADLLELTEAEATNLFARLHPENGQLADSELETVSAGCGDDACIDGGEHTYERFSSMSIDGKLRSKRICSKCGKQVGF